jgi:hypothetical protein
MPNPPKTPSFSTQATRSIVAKRSSKTTSSEVPFRFPTLEAFLDGLDFNENPKGEEQTDGDPILGFGW